MSPSVRLMVDGELWTRFFRYDSLYNVDCILGGYRLHGSNRAAKFIDQCLLEMNNSIEVLAKHCDSSTLARSATLRLLHKLANAPIPRRILGKDLALSLLTSVFCKPFLGDLRHQCISWNHYNSSWELGSLPYRA